MWLSPRSIWLPLSVAVPLVAAAACSSDGSSPATSTTSSAPASATPTSEATGGACAAVTGNATATPPSDVPTPSDATFYQTSKAGATTLFFAYTTGDDVKQRRDDIKQQLQSAG